MKKILIILIAMLISSIALKAQNGGYCLDFNGTNQYVTVPHNAAFNVSAITIEAWFYWTGTGVEFITGKDLEGFEIHTTSDNRLRFIPASYVWLDTPENSISPNEWTHVAMSYNPSIGFKSCYINGVEIELIKNGGNPLTTPIKNTNDPFLIALRLGDIYPFDGKIDEVRVWNDVRTADEVRANMYKELAGNEAGLVAYYKMSNGSGTTVSDNGPNNLDGTTQNSPYWQTSGALAGSRTALDFDGVNEYVSISGSAPLNFSGMSNFTFEAWIYYTSAGAIFAKRGFNGQAEYAFFINNADSKIQFLVGKQSTAWQNIINSNATITSNEWTHVTLVKNGANASLYLNGVLDKVGLLNATSQSATTSVSALHLGNNFSGNIGGKMDEVRIWNDVRTEAEIRENMMRNLVGNEAGLVAYYNFNDGGGSTAHDLTSNGLNGTLTNMENADWVTSGAFNMWLGIESNISNNAVNWSDGVPLSGQNVDLSKYNLSFNTAISGTPTYNNIYLENANALTLSSGFTANGNIFLNQAVDLNSYTVTLGSNAYLYESTLAYFYGTSGIITTTRNLSGITAENVAGLGAIITTAANMGSTTINRRYGNNTIFSGSSLLRAYDINPTNNSGLNATLIFNYSEQDINGRTESDLALYKSTNSGTTWIGQGGLVVPAINTITITGIDAFSRWAASDVDVPITLTTTTISAIGNSTAMSGGEITDDGGLNISLSGICWNTGGTPTIADSKTTDGATSETSFESQLTALSPYQIYYVRAYATNASGTYYGNEVSFTTVPTLGEWGLIALGSLFALGGGFFIWRRFIV